MGLINKAMPEEEVDEAETAEEMPAAQASEDPASVAVSANTAETSTDDEGGEAPTPEQQQHYERLVLAGLKILYEKKTSGPMIQHLRQRAENPAEALADTAAMVITQLDKAAKGKIPREVILPAAGEILSEVAMLAEKSSAFTATEEHKADAVQLMIMAIVQQFGVDEADKSEFMASVDVEGAKKSIQSRQSATAPTEANKEVIA